MSFAREGEPHLAADLVIADDATHTRMENLRAAARARIHAGSFHFLQSLFDRKLGNARKVVNLDHRESFEMHVRMAFFSGR